MTPVSSYLFLSPLAGFIGRSKVNRSLEKVSTFYPTTAPSTSAYRLRCLLKGNCSRTFPLCLFMYAKGVSFGLSDKVSMETKI